MATIIRPELSKNNKYYISRHRYYELKHFCLQYPEWKKIYNDICREVPGGIIKLGESPQMDKRMYVRQLYFAKMCLVEECAKLTDPILGNYILRGVTEGLTYSYFRTVERIPCCKDTYYELYRKFFYILHKKKDFA